MLTHSSLNMTSIAFGSFISFVLKETLQIDNRKLSVFPLMNFFIHTFVYIDSAQGELIGFGPFAFAFT